MVPDQTSIARELAGPAPRFRSSPFVAATSDANFGNKRGTGKAIFLVPLFDLKFLVRTCSNLCRNFKSAALVVIDDRSRLPGRFFGRFTTAATSGLARAL
jgi:hypothetical protein